MHIPMLKLEQIKIHTLGGLRSNSKSICWTVIAGVFLSVIGCGHSTVVNTQAGGHQIRAIIAGNDSMDSQPDRATFSSEFGTVTVERARVQISSAPWTLIPEAVPVELKISKGRIALTAGNVTIKQTTN